MEPSVPPALPWAEGALALPEKRLQDIAANMALLGAARAITRRAGVTPEADTDAEEVVAAELQGMSQEERTAAAMMLQRTQARIFEALQQLQAEGGLVTADRVVAIMQRSKPE